LRVPLHRRAAAAAFLLLILVPASTARADAPPAERAEDGATISAPARGHMPDVMPAGKNQAKPATVASAATFAPFLTRPYWHPHTVTSIFDHCNPNYTHDNLICEYDGTVASRWNGVAPDFAYGYATSPGSTDYLYYDGHDGWDLALNYEPLLAAADGVVYFAGWSQYGYGLSVIIDHPNGLSTRYGHMSVVDVQAGDHVQRGQKIGTSGNTGVSTGPHLHFGVYRNDPWTPIDPWGWTGAGADPWPYELGNLWFGGNPQDPVPTAPQNVTAVAAGNAATVSWSPPAFDGGSPITTYTVRSDPPDLLDTLGANAASTTFANIPYGRTYTFTVTADNAVGSGATSAPSNAVSSATPNFTAWFAWYDNASPGMAADNIHLFNPGSTDVNGYLVIGWRAQPITVGAGKEAFFSFPAGTIGGPVQLMASGTLVGSQRVQYHQSFNEVAAVPSSAGSTSLWWPWYDHASPGMEVDNVHVVNPSKTAANVTVSLAGLSSSVRVPAEGEAHVSFPQGTIGGPLRLTSDQPVLAAQRVEYGSSFNETAGRPAAAAATTSWINWHDTVSPGMRADNVHVLNPGSQAVTVTISVPGAAPSTLTVPAGEQRWFSTPQPAIGGPVRISASGPVLASQRVQYYDSFNEVPARALTDAAGRSYLSWYDTFSPGMIADNIHVLNPGASAVTGTVALAGSVVSFSLDPGAERYFGFGSGVINGPVTINASGPVIASQRVQYYQSFNEVLAGS
jgi:murein DD-endopeptidase MepM/ murein hydrolase activator NlpD